MIIIPIVKIINIQLIVVSRIVDVGVCFKFDSNKVPTLAKSSPIRQNKTVKTKEIGIPGKKYCQKVTLHSGNAKIFNGSGNKTSHMMLEAFNGFSSIICDITLNESFSLK